MPAVEFSDRAEIQLAAMDPAVAGQLRSTAAKILHAVPADPDPELARIEGLGGTGHVAPSRRLRSPAAGR